MNTPPPFPLIVNEWTDADMVAAAEAVNRGRGRWELLREKLTPWGIATIVVSIVVLMIARTSWSAALIVGAVSGGLVWRALSPVKALALLRARARARGLAGLMELRLTSDTLLVRGAQVDTAFPWAAVLVEESGAGLLLRMSATSVYIPNRVLEAAGGPEGRAQLIAYVQTRAAERAAPTSPGAELRFSLTRADWRTATWWAFSRLPVVRALVILFVGAYVLLLLLSISEGVFDPRRAVGVLLTALGWGLIFAVPLEVALWRTPSPGTLAVGLEDGGLVWDAGATTRFPWDHVASVQRTRRYLFVEIAAYGTLCVPARAFPDDAAFQAFYLRAEDLWRRPRWANLKID